MSAAEQQEYLKKLDVNTQMKMLQQGWHLFGIRRFFDDQPKSPTETPPEKQNVYGEHEGSGGGEMKNLDTLCSAAVAAAEASSEQIANISSNIAGGTVKRSHAETEDDYDDIDTEEQQADYETEETKQNEKHVSNQQDSNNITDDNQDNEALVGDTDINKRDIIEESTVVTAEEQDIENDQDEDDEEDDDDDDEEDDDIEDIDNKKISEKERKRLAAVIARKVAKNEKRIDAYMQKLVEEDEKNSPSKSRRLSTRLENLILSNVALKPEDLSQALCDLNGPDLVRVFPQISNFNSSASIHQFVQQQQQQQQNHQKQLQASEIGGNNEGKISIIILKSYNSNTARFFTDFLHIP